MKITSTIINKIKEEAKKYFVDTSGCHDWSHVERVYNLAMRMGKKEKANLKILTMACILHDVARRDEMKAKGKFCHAEEGVKIAEKILKKYKVDKKTIDNVSHCILAHRYRNNHIPQTIEAKILYDADKLDSIGAIGIGRIFLFAGTFGSNRLYTGREKELAKDGKNHSYSKEDSAALEYYFKLKKIKSKMLTKTGKIIAKERHDFMAQYFQRFWREIP